MLTFQPPNKNILFQKVKDYFSKEERAERKDARKAKKSAKTDEIRSRAELNKSLAQDKPSDLALAQALQASSASPRTADKKMSGTTKTVLIVVQYRHMQHKWCVCVCVCVCVFQMIKRTSNTGSMCFLYHPNQQVMCSLCLQ